MNSSSSLGMTYQVRAGPPMRTARPLDGGERRSVFYVLWEMCEWGKLHCMYIPHCHFQAGYGFLFHGGGDGLRENS